jgi:parallel beta-helix repeat protein
MLHRAGEDSSAQVFHKGIAMSASARQHTVFLLGFLFAGLPGIALGGDSDTLAVDCGRGESIQDALGKKKLDRPLIVVIRGACTENVTVAQDDVTLAGDGGAITGAVTIDGARRAVLADLTISNPGGDGVTVANGASATLRNNRIDDNAGYGVFLRNAAFAIVNNNTMLRNGIVNPTTIDASGIGVSMGSTVRATLNEIRENANTGVEVFDNSIYRSDGDTIAMRTSAPGRSAVDAFRAGHVELRGATVSGNVFLTQQSHVQVRNLEGLTSTITGNLSADGLSFLRIRAGVVRVASAVGCGQLSICRCDGFASCLAVP